MRNEKAIEETKKLANKSRGILKEFKEFISKGNVLDMAVGVIIGSAFSKIVSSLVDNILMPVIGVLIGGHDFEGLAITIGTAKIKYGIFIQNVIDFLIVAACLFTVVKIVNRLNRKKEVKEEVKESEELTTLKEIRDLLKNNN